MVPLQVSGGIEAFGAGTDKTLMGIYQSVASGPWSRWAPLGGTLRSFT